ncbi:uncharacterized protein CIMG_06492 [Coccidioides immitis RS]|uniref:Uncharacterized protein n=1 Tax=Coccidioides immitis (strain RS) TaxID=246410 RepID=A0A0E1RW12_COCIM|nr:uncharacterized protein CIMG_06492 [Coccidioides immitis RS]EAS31013.2 hypothetical protein CIMG_06492 [Coccidioides immitis RS]
MSCVEDLPLIGFWGRLGVPSCGRFALGDQKRGPMSDPLQGTRTCDSDSSKVQRWISMYILLTFESSVRCFSSASKTVAASQLPHHQSSEPCSIGHGAFYWPPST